MTTELDTYQSISQYTGDGHCNVPDSCCSLIQLSAKRPQYVIKSYINNFLNAEGDNAIQNMGTFSWCQKIHQPHAIRREFLYRDSSMIMVH